MFSLKQLVPRLSWFLQSSYLVSSNLDARLGPTVDLGYELHRSTAHDLGGYYNFSNVRYGAAPTGQGRFAAPDFPTKPYGPPPLNDGQTGVICPQGVPEWQNTARESLASMNITHKGSDYSDYSTKDIPPVDPRTSEDCLFLDILVPQKAFDSRSEERAAEGPPDKSQKKSSPSSGAAVLVWIHGGGYAFGWKDQYGYGDGLIERSLEDDNEGIIYIALNYRLGLFGFLSGSKLEEGAGTPNAGLLDQRLALEWVQDNIHLFGGNPDKVTIMGESAGGGSVVYQLAAHRGPGHSIPFRAALPQSPYFGLTLPSKQQNDLFDEVLDLAQVVSLAELKEVSSTSIQIVNSLMIGRAAYGALPFGPVIDGNDVPDRLITLLAEGRFDKSIDVMIGHNSNEGRVFASPYVHDQASYEAYLSSALPPLAKHLVDEIASDIYPPVYDGSEGYTSMLQRVSASFGELNIDCNTRFVESAFSDNVYSYLFAANPGWHGNDLPYTFYGRATDVSSTGVDPELAHQMQRYFVNFVMTGSPEIPLAVPAFPKYGAKGNVQNFNTTQIRPKPDGINEEHCRWWHRQLLESSRAI